MFQPSDPHADQNKKATQATAVQPAVYGILLENEQVLLRRNPQTGLWQPPGQLLQRGQLPQQAISTAFQALVMFSPQTGTLVFMEEVLASTASAQPQNLTRLYYLLKRPPGVLAAIQESGKRQDVQWTAIHDLRREQMHLGYAAILVAWRRMRWKERI
jgi:hypothetical protein